ncbi:tryptophan--tRNA ligase [Actinotalea sp. M2MS4P-6]|uniref:tryptophan--tRNA ligase n=1 Tax=Actinotalea sp. M2MS4P-6 TaxID=2983762 RepID=UPI0021E49F46|nr:tryptophan--tRNA ligase [Actinotalea sp. M2MS4P-6]MCV2395280.1 tryptophan--tRNA ligase [Actinotalea sp. M2MS4P-6]
MSITLPTTPAPVPPSGQTSGLSSSLDLAAERAVDRGLHLEGEVAAHPERFRVLTGERPTGPLHLGHYFGTVANRVRLQQLGVEVLLVVADYQVITDREVAGDVRGAVHEIVLDYLASGLDPARTTVFQHSAVPALNQLMLPFLSLVTVAELDRNPTVKAELAASGAASMSGLLLTYPVHQAADILFCHANLVPVGKDQLPHLEMTRLVARRFNQRYGAGYFPEPDGLLSAAPTVLGTDGRKMSKSGRNAIALRDDADATARAIRSARTDSEREITYEPDRRPEVANLLLLTALSTGRSPQEIAAEVGGRGAGQLKQLTTDALVAHLAPVRARRAELAADPAVVAETLAAGAARANALADATLADVRRLMAMA